MGLTIRQDDVTTLAYEPTRQKTVDRFISALKESNCHLERTTASFYNIYILVEREVRNWFGRKSVRAEKVHWGQIVISDYFPNNIIIESRSIVIDHTLRRAAEEILKDYPTWTIEINRVGYVVT